MRYWCFHEGQLAAATAAYLHELAGGLTAAEIAALRREIERFLFSGTLARAGLLRGDATPALEAEAPGEEAAP